MSIQRFETGPRMSQVVVHGNTVYLAGVVADKTAGESVTKQTEEILSIIDGHLASAGSDADKVSEINLYFGEEKFPPYWILWQSISGLIQVYDLETLDPVRATTYLSRLGAIAGALLANRDDIRGFPEDPFRGRVMPAWGAPTANRDGKWNTDVVTSGLFLHAMAAFARRVMDQPDRYPQFQDQAITLITAAIETYEAFRAELPSHRQRPACLLRLAVELQESHVRQRGPRLRDLHGRSRQAPCL